MNKRTNLMACLAILVIGAIGLAAVVLPGVKDASLKLTRALPGSNTTVYSLGIDTGVTPSGVQPANVEYLLTAPALTVAQLSDAATAKYSILYDTVAPIDGASTVYITDAIVQTGAGGAGAASKTFRFRLPSDAGRIIGFKITTDTNLDASAVSATLDVLF